MTTKVVTGKARLNHVHLSEQFGAEGRDPAFSTMVMIPKSDTATMDAIRAAEAEATENAKDRLFGGKVPKGLSSIWKDGDTAADEYPEQAGHWYAWVSKKGQGRDVAPPVIDTDGTEMFDKSEIYSGAYAQVSMEAFAFSNSGNRGVTFSLRAVKKVADGDRLGPVDNPAGDFDDDDLF